VRWDREQYRQEVLEPARRSGNVPPADLYVRYGLPRNISDPAAFDARVAEVLALWHELATKRMYEHLADKLITAHAELVRAGPLTLAKFAEHHAQAHRQQLARLDRLASAEAGAATHVGLATVTRLRSALGGSVTDAEIAAALIKAGVRVVEEFPALPATPHPKYAALAQYVQALGRQLSAEAVFGDGVRAGFRVLRGFQLADGRRLDGAVIAAANDRVDALPHSDPAKTHAKNVLTVLSGAARAGELDALLLSEVVEWLRRFADQGFVQRAIATQARELGLAENEAGLVAAALLSRDSVETVRQLVTAELGAGRLRNAQRLVTGLPAGDPLRERVVALDAEVAALIRRADGELAQGHTEQAAKLLAEATGMASDDTRLTERLARLPPPPPGAATARVDQGRLVVSWKPSPALAGRLHYRVLRGQDRAPSSPTEGDMVVQQSEQQEVTDLAAPLGARLCYSVFAGRGGGTWSSPAVTAPVLFAPDVTDVSIAVAETAVTASWLTHPRADRVLVVRAEGHTPEGPGDGTAVDASRAGFTDTGLRSGTEYFYRIVVSYPTPDGPRQSAGIVRRAVPEPEPEAVTDLTATVLDGAPVLDGSPPVIEASWTPPRYGQVRLVLLTDGAPRWAAGTRLAREDAARLREIPGAPRPGAGGRHVLRLHLPYGQHYLLALTTAGDATVAGSSTQIRLAEPVRGLTAVRMHDAVRLGWEWPDSDATDAEVRWPGGVQHCSRRVYEDEGGVTITIGPAGTRVEVRPVYARPAGRHTGPAAHVQVPGRGVTVDYRIRRASWRRPRDRIIELAAERATRLPALVAVRSTGRYPPGDPADGEAVARVEPQPIAPEQPVTITVAVGRGPAWLACFVDPDPPDRDAPDVVLRPPPGGEMRIR
jgi:hypothetical protein